MDLKKYVAGSGKKCEFSNDPKKQREGSLNDSQSLDDIFAKRLSSPDCVEILFNCIKNGEADCRNL